MSEATVIRLAETKTVPFGPDSFYQLLVGDDAGNTPMRVGIQTAEPGYAAGMHSHPYLEVLHILEGTAEAWLEGQEDRPVRLEVGDTIALPPDTPHTFRAVGDRVLRLMGIHASPTRIVRYRDGRPASALGYPVVDE
jgi:mannose-6-phosphate isomerase-like protein (cupin superfamily)